MSLPSDRRQFMRLAVGAILVVPAGRFLVACGSEDDYGGSTGGGGGADAPAAAPRADGSNVVYTSNNVLAHFHTFAVASAALTAPVDMNGATSDAGGHSHDVTVSMAQLATVKSGGTVKITTSTVDGHSHVLTLVKLSSSSGAGADGGTGGGGGGGGGYPY